jgi:plasmid replication initiation protein
VSRELQYNYNNVVTKSNVLIEANYKLTTTEQKIILFLVSKIRKEDNDFQTYTLPIKEFCDLLGYQGTPKYSELRKITKELIGKVLEIREGKKLIQVSWLSYVEYSENEGSVVLSFDPRLKPYLLELKREFTSYKLKNVMELKSSYSIRIYEILKKWQNTKEVKISLAELRQMVGATDKYLDYHNFKKRVLTPSQKEITAKTDIFFKFKEVKKGRKVDSITFLINKSEIIEHEQNQIGEGNQQELDLFQDDNKNQRDALLTLGISSSQIDNILTTYPIEQIQRNIDFVIKKKQEDEIKNLAGFCYSAIKGDWAILDKKNEADGPKKPKNIIRTEMLPSWFDESEDAKEKEKKRILKSGTIEEKRQLYFEEFSFEDHERGIEKSLENWLKLRSEEVAKEIIIENLILPDIQKRQELGIKILNVEDYVNPVVRGLYQMALDSIFAPVKI